MYSVAGINPYQPQHIYRAGLRHRQSRQLPRVPKSGGAIFTKKT